MKYDAIIFIGPQGSGKGTQAQLLAHKLDAVFIEMGGLFREIAKEDSVLGKYVKETIEQGKLLTDEDVEKVLSEKILTIPAGKTIVFDGVPRRMGQANFLVSYLKIQGREKIATIFIDIPREETLRRLSLRRVCVDCKTPTISNGDPDQVCMKCGGSLVQRADDKPDAINVRLDAYEKETLPVVEYLKNETKFFQINGLPPIEEVTLAINLVMES